VVLVFVGVDGQAKTVALVRDAGCYPVGMQKMTKACLDGMSVRLHACVFAGVCVGTGERRLELTYGFLEGRTRIHYYRRHEASCQK
jgi:hypothetical protein